MYGVYFKNSSSASPVLDSTHNNLENAEQESSRLRTELSEHLTWPGWCVWVETLGV